MLTWNVLTNVITNVLTNVLTNVITKMYNFKDILCIFYLLYISYS